MGDSLELKKHKDVFSRIILYVRSVDVKIKEEDHESTLLSSLPRSYEHIVYTLMYGKEILTMNEVRDILSSKEIYKKAIKKENISELIVIGRRVEGNNTNERGKSRYKSRGSKKCYHYYKEGHFKRDCLEGKH